VSEKTDHCMSCNEDYMKDDPRAGFKRMRLHKGLDGPWGKPLVRIMSGVVRVRLCPRCTRDYANEDYADEHQRLHDE